MLQVYSLLCVYRWTVQVAKRTENYCVRMHPQLPFMWVHCHLLGLCRQLCGTDTANFLGKKLWFCDWFCGMIKICPCIFTEWAGRWYPWHGAVGQPAWRSAANAVHWLYPEEPHSAGPSGSLATP